MSAPVMTILDTLKNMEEILRTAPRMIAPGDVLGVFIINDVAINWVDFLREIIPALEEAEAAKPTPPQGGA